MVAAGWRRLTGLRWIENDKLEKFRLNCSRCTKQGHKKITRKLKNNYNNNNNNNDNNNNKEKKSNKSPKNFTRDLCLLIPCGT